MASNPIATPSYLATSSSGLQPNSDGLRPSSFLQLVLMASNLIAMASKLVISFLLLVVMASNLIAMASILVSLLLVMCLFRDELAGEPEVDDLQEVFLNGILTRESPSRNIAVNELVLALPFGRMVEPRNELFSCPPSHRQIP